MSITIDNLTLTEAEAIALRDNSATLRALHDAECGCGWDGSDILNLIPAPKGVTR